MQKRFRSLNAFKVAFIAPREASRSTLTLSFLLPADFNVRLRLP